MARTVPLALLALALSACSVDLKVPEGAQISCASDADCPAGYVCRTTVSQCFKAGGDAVAPEVLPGTLVVTPERVGANTPVVTVTFQVSEALSTDPVAELTWPAVNAARPLVVKSQDAATRTWTLIYAPVPGTDPEGVVGLDATLTDTGGNRSRVVDDNVALFDFTPPALAEDLGGGKIASFTLTPPATSPLRDVTALAPGTRLRVDFAASEQLAGGADAPAVTLTSGATSVPLAQVSGNGLSYVYDVLVDGSLPQGTATVTARLTDLAGNLADVSLGTLQVISQRPAAPNVNGADMVLFHRVPWGSEDTQGSEAYFLRGTAASVPAGSVVIAYSDPDVISSAGKLVGREVARVAANPDGSFGGDVGSAAPFQLFMGDTPDLYVATVDAAGNVSDADGNPANGAQASLVRDVTWTASLQGKIAGRVFPNPHAFEGREVFTATLAQFGARPLSTPADVGRADGVKASVRGAPYWQPARRLQSLGPRGGTGMVHDPVRDCRVAYSGFGWDGCDSGFFCSQWESCRGSAWTTPVPADPEGDGNPVLGTDFPLVFAGGRAAAVLSTGTDLWEWNGDSWRRFVLSDPEGDGDPVARTGHAIAYDEARQRLLLFGGTQAGGTTKLSDLWETDFHSWRRLCAAAPCSTGARPAARSDHAMIYDPSRKLTILVGGNTASGYDAATWTWNGTGWASNGCTTGTCALAAQRDSLGITFDPVRNVVVTFGGYNVNHLDGVYEWNGSWTARCTTTPCSTTKPTPRSSPSLFYDPTRGRTVLFGGAVDFGSAECGSGPFCDSEWEWDGTGAGAGTGTWTRIGDSSAQPAPPSVTGVTPVYDASRDRVVLFGGQGASGATNQTWLWNGATWAQAGPATVPSARINYGAAYIAGSNQVAMFGGVASGVNQTTGYVWNGSNWTLVTGTAPAGRYYVPMAQSTRAAPGGALLFGGYDGGTEYCDLWEVTSGAWSLRSNVCSGSIPSARYAAAMTRATGFTGSPVLLFGGTSSFTDLNDLWSFNGSTWTQLSAGGAASATQPVTRSRAGLFFDTARNRAVLWGGSPSAVISNVNCVDDYGGTACHDFWEWSGSGWTRVFPVNLYGDGNPDPYRLSGIAFDTLRKLGVGLDTTGAVKTWWWHGGADERPGQLASFLFDAAEVRRAYDVLDLSAEWVGGGTGAPAGTVTNGASLQLWDNRGWRTLAQSATARPGAPETLSWTLSLDGALGALPLAERQRFMVGDGRVLYLALVPNAASGSAAGFGEVTTDYVEVTVKYRLAP